MDLSTFMILCPILMLWMCLIVFTTANMIKYTIQAIKERDYNFL